ncbi:MAG: RecQ family ATP-dependent DNA helicase [Planctomycetes bacterium]|nr:RecQ family ATP-dependent DNA helicase [Planctomycetota bacterium]
MTDADIHRVLRSSFGLDAFRPHQEEVVRAVLAGRDALLCLPTGGGKSLTYQLPALVLDGLTLVISPLIALMDDQVRALQERGLRAACVHSQVERSERQRRLEQAARGELDLLYVTPERLRSPAFRALASRLPLSRMAIDEAHCVSQWGHDFRPDYSRLAVYREELGNPPTLAVTATATPRVAEDICSRVGLREPLVVRAGIERPNLFLAATEVFDEDERLELVGARLRALEGAGIVYLTRIRDLERLAEDLRAGGLRTLAYHGGMSAHERRRAQRRWTESADEVVLATPAFGLGVDKPDCRFVLHAQAPRTLEAWLQELGRAGRDGQPAWCELLFHEEDIELQRSFIRWANPSREYLLQVHDFLASLGERLALFEADDVRRELLVKERHDRRLELCMRWLDTLGVTRGSLEERDLEFLRPLLPSELPEGVGSAEKERGDLLALLGVVEAVRDRSTCRRAAFAAHFGLEAAASCGACDACVEAGAALARVGGSRERGPRRPARPAAPEGGSSGSSTPRGPEVERLEGAAAGATFQRGDWVQTGGRHLGRVVRVEGSGARVKLVVESQTDLRRRTIDPRRVRVERLDPGR